MKRILNATFFSIIIMLLTGCDTMYGVMHQNWQVSNFDKDCVYNALLSVNEISDVKYRLDEGDRPLTLHGIEKPEEIHRFFYKYSNLNGNFYFQINYDGKIEFHQTYFALNSIPPQHDIDLMRPIMLKIEKTIGQKCNLAELTSSMKEVCNGVKCN